MSDHKFPHFDKYDLYMPNKPHWTHNNYYVSLRLEHFNVASTCAAIALYHTHLKFGVSKRADKASGAGILTDRYCVGKADAS